MNVLLGWGRGRGAGGWRGMTEGSQSIAQAYAGHQFGHFTMLGDGRAITIGEHLRLNNKRFYICIH